MLCLDEERLINVPKKNYWEKSEEGEIECQQIWEWLKIVPAYLEDYEAFKKTDDHKKIEHAPFYPIWFKKPLTDSLKLKRKWGFYPLQDPYEKYRPDIFDQICDLFSGETVDLIVIEHDKTPSFPVWRKIITLDIAIDKPIASILDAVKSIALSKQKELKIGVKESSASRVGNLAFIYRVFVFLRIGWTEAKIREFTKKKIEKHQDAYRKKIDRAIRKAKQVINTLDSM